MTFFNLTYPTHNFDLTIIVRSFLNTIPVFMTDQFGKKSSNKTFKRIRQNFYNCNSLHKLVNYSNCYNETLVPKSGLERTTTFSRTMLSLTMLSITTISITTISITTLSITAFAIAIIKR
jgi:hypothetical protein